MTRHTFDPAFTARQSTGQKLLTATRLQNGLGRYAGLERRQTLVMAPAVWTWPRAFPTPYALAWCLWLGFTIGVVL